MNSDLTASWPAGLADAFARYERALMADDLPALAELFADGDDTLRGDVAGLLVGSAEISAFRSVRGGAPPRVIVASHVQVIDATHALVVAVTAPRRGGRGLQTQLWRRDGDDRWRITAAQVGAPPSTFDPTVWRIVGDPLVAGSTAVGPLTGESVAVKDLFAVAGHPVGAGVPAYLAESRTSPAHASAVERLLTAGAALRGIARTDQFAYSLAGTNEHYGTPVNAVVAGAIPGGSSSGSATAVALGVASIGLATDTAGSVRVPASYQGLWGLRTTHGAVDRAGLLALAPSFDTIGLLTRDAALLAMATSVLLDPGRPAHQPAAEVVVAADLLAGLDPTTAAAVSAAAQPLATTDVEVADVLDLDAAVEAFRIHQAFEAWEVHGGWILRHPGAVVGAAAARFAAAADVRDDEDAAAQGVLAGARTALDEALGNRVLLLPSAASTAPRVWDSVSQVERARAATMRLTCLAGITGRPAVSAPALLVGEAPLGLCLLGPRDSDLALVELAGATFAGR